MSSQTAEFDFMDEVQEITPQDDSDIFIVDLDGFDGPIDLLLDLAKNQKLDLTQISVLELAKQYLAFIDHAVTLKLEIAGDYLVMAAWLAYLKSRLLLPEDEVEEGELTSQEMAELLAFQLQRLEAMRQSGDALSQRSQLNHDFFARGIQDGLRLKTQLEFDLKWHDLLNTYGRLMAAREKVEFKLKPRKVFKIEDAIQRLTGMLGLTKDWATMSSFLPLEEINDFVVRKSAVASTFGAILELTKQGRADVRQDQLFGEIYMRALSQGVKA